MPPLVEAHQVRTSLQPFPGEDEVSFALCRLQEDSSPGFLIFYQEKNQTWKFSAIVTELYPYSHAISEGPPEALAGRVSSDFCDSISM